MGVEGLCTATPSGTDTSRLQGHPQHPEEEQPHITSPPFHWLPSTHPLTWPFQTPGLRQGGLQGTPSLRLLLHSPVWTRKQSRASSLFLTFFSPLNIKQDHMHKPHVHAHSTQWRVSHFASFQSSKIPGQWCRADITPQISIMPLSIPAPTLAK